MLLPGTVLFPVGGVLLDFGVFARKLRVANLSKPKMLEHCLLRVSLDNAAKPPAARPAGPARPGWLAGWLVIAI